MSYSDAATIHVATEKKSIYNLENVKPIVIKYSRSTKGMHRW